MHSLRVRGLTPRAWFNRCASVWPDVAAQAADGITSEDGPALLKELAERFEAFDEYIGTCPIVLDPTFVANTRTLLGSLKKFRDTEGNDRELTAAAEAKFVKNNTDAKAGQIPRRFREGMRRFLREVLSSYGERLGVPHFGPGAVAEHLPIVDRWNQIASNRVYDFRSPDMVEFWGQGAQAPVARLHAVPKDWNKKRLITVEPFEQSYLQHYTRENLWRALAHCKIAGLRSLVTPKVRDPQMRHRRLACQGSVDGSLATLDMSDASDLVSFNQVASVFPADVMADLERSRSAQFTATTFSGTHDIHMYGGMGNATTFTVETLVFHAACWAIAEYHRLSFRDSFVSCYGDDMIVSTRLAELITDLDLFTEFGWRLNKTKSYWRPIGKFRESCGGQYYAGQDVTLLRYQGGYKGIYGLVAYRDLIMRAARNKRWRELTWHPWDEQNMPNTTSWLTEGALVTSVPWWPDTYRGSARSNRATQEKELLLPAVTIPKRIHTVTSLGPVYGAIAGQLASQTGTQRLHGRKAYGVLAPVPNRVAIRDRWVAVGELDCAHPNFGTVPGRPGQTDDTYVQVLNKRAGRSV